MLKRPAIEHLPIAPLFVDRMTEMAALDDDLHLCSCGRLVGVRRCSAADAIITPPMHFIPALVSGALGAVRRAIADIAKVFEKNLSSPPDCP